MARYILDSFIGGISDTESYGIRGAFKFGKNLNIRKKRDTLSCNQALIDELPPGSAASPSSSASASQSPSESQSVSVSPSISPSSSASPSASASETPSPSSSISPSSSLSPSSSASPSSSESPSLSSQDVGFGTIIDWFVPASDGNIYGGGRNGQVFRRKPGGDWDIVYTDVYGPILGMWEWGTNDGKQRIYWATAKRLNRKEIPGADDWSDVNTDSEWPKTTLTEPLPGFNHMMRGIGGGVGALAVCNDETLALVGYDDSYTNEILRFTPGNAAKTLLQRDNNLIIGTTAKNQLVNSAIFLWDGHDTEEVFGWDDMKPLPVRDITAMIDGEVPLVVDDLGQVFYSDFRGGMPVFTFPDGGTVSPGGVDNDGYLALFGVHGNGNKAGIYSYGRQWKNSPLVLNLEYSIECDEIGAILRVGDDLLVSYSSGGYYGIKNIDPNNKAVAVYESIDLPRPSNYPFQKQLTWSQVVLHLDKPLPEGANISCQYKLNKNDDYLDANLRDGSLEFSVVGAQEAVFFTGGNGEVANLKLTLTPSGNDAPEIRQIEWFFD